MKKNKKYRDFLLTCRACTTNLVGLDRILLGISLDYYLKKRFYDVFIHKMIDYTIE